MEKMNMNDFLRKLRTTGSTELTTGGLLFWCCLVLPDSVETQTFFRVDE